MELLVTCQPVQEEKTGQALKYSHYFFQYISPTLIESTIAWTSVYRILKGTNQQLRVCRHSHLQIY